MSESTIDAINARLDRIERLTLLGAKTVFDLNETVLFTGLSKAHIYRLTSEKQIPHFKKAKKLYFKKSELENWMLENRVKTNKEIQSMANTYIATH